MNKLVDGQIVPLTADDLAQIAIDEAAFAAVTADKVDAFRDARLAAGYADTTTGKTYQADPTSIALLTPIGAAAGLAVTMATSPPPNFEIIAADNSIVTLSTADTYALLHGRIMPWVSATMLYARTLKNAIAAGNPPTDVTAGWP